MDAHGVRLHYPIPTHHRISDKNYFSVANSPNVQKLAGLQGVMTFRQPQQARTGVAPHRPASSGPSLRRFFQLAPTYPLQLWRKVRTALGQVQNSLPRQPLAMRGQ